jgi:hypothetical protein
MPTKPRPKAGKKASARKPAKRRSAPAAARTAMRKLAPLNRLFDALRPPMTRGAIALDAAGGTTAVKFTCNNAGAVLVTITTHAGAVLLRPSQTVNLPSGKQDIVWSARGTTGAAFKVTVTGGSLDAPIDAILPSGGTGGFRFLTVS